MAKYCKEVGCPCYKFNPTNTYGHPMHSVDPNSRQHLIEPNGCSFCRAWQDEQDLITMTPKSGAASSPPITPITKDHNMAARKKKTSARKRRAPQLRLPQGVDAESLSANLVAYGKAQTSQARQRMSAAAERIGSSARQDGAGCRVDEGGVGACLDNADEMHKTLIAAEKVEKFFGDQHTKVLRALYPERYR